MPYYDQILAIREMLANPSPEIVQEGYDLLFKLWMINSDNPDFKHEIKHDAIKYSQLIPELTTRLIKLQLTSSITNTYLRKRLESLASDAEDLRRALITKGSNTSLQSANINIPKGLNRKYSWWQLLLVGIIVISTLLTIYLPDLYQKILAVVIAVGSAVTFPYIFPQKDHMISVDSAEIKINYSFPKYLSIGDENTVHISIENSGQANFSGRITLIFDDPGSFVTPAPDQNLSVKMDLPPHGRESKQFKFQVLKKPSDKDLNYHFEISSDKEQYVSNEGSFSIAPIPYLRSTWAWLFGSAGVGIALFWEQLEKLFGFK